MDGPWRKFTALLWKNFLTRQNKWKTALFQIFIIIGGFAVTSYLDGIDLYTLSFWMFLMVGLISLYEMGFPAQEKLTGINILMNNNGVENWMNLASWLLSGIISNMLVYALPIFVILINHPISFSNSFIFLLTMLFQVIHCMCLGYHFSSYFNNEWKGSFLMIMIVGLPFLIKILGLFENIDRLVLYYGIISPFSLLQNIAEKILSKKTTKDNLFENSTSNSTGMLILFSIIGALLHFSLAIYINAIRPGRYGVARHPFAWFIAKKKNDENYMQLNDVYLQKTNDKFECIPQGSLEPGIRIRELKKTYQRGLIKKTKVHALRGVSVDFYKSQITALLGHNGAGKTTMMSILSGLAEPSKGQVYIGEENIQYNSELISSNVSLCPQVNMTFNELNVYQHLIFFGTLRSNGRSMKKLEEDVEILLSKINLTNKKNSLPNQLSGGQKRRLCLAMSIIGDANVLILDEPTAGMDPESKREVWDMILQMRGQKTILISTHDMEEADILGDRIAIMHSGELKNYGTSMFLKKLYGDGQVQVSLSVESGYNKDSILSVLGINVKSLSEDDESIVFEIPNSNSLPSALDRLETSKRELGITGINASLITLEQIFLKVTGIDDNTTSDDIKNSSELLFKRNTGFSYFMQTFWGYFVKNWAYSMKGPLSFLIRLILPCLLTGLMLLLPPVTIGQPGRSRFEEQVKAVSVLIHLSLIFLLPLYVTLPLSEATSGIKQLQHMTGASKILYWASIFIFDFIHYTISVLLLMASSLFVDKFFETHFYPSTDIFNRLRILLQFGVTGLLYIYVMALLKFSKKVTIFIGVAAPILIFIIILTISSFIGEQLIYTVFTIPPINFIFQYIDASIPDGPFPLDPEKQLTSYIYSGGSFIVCILIIFIVEQNILKVILSRFTNNNSSTFPTTSVVDELVQKEKLIVKKEVEKRLNKTVEDDNENVFLADNLMKSYGNLQVVKGISLRVKKSECYGLLGVNGAGKSTTFKMLSGDEIPHNGTMFLNNIGLHENRGKYLSEMGYCPQQNIINDSLNAWDHLFLFARLRGVPESKIYSNVENLINKLSLTACASQPSHTYSGGNKRRLNVAMALIGRPSLALMDEPTAGVDPAARKSLWSTFKRYQKSGQSIILTSHSMEECEALCNRLVIMVQGQLVCVGAVQELKQRFGAGYNINIKMSPVARAEDVQMIKEKIQSTLVCRKMDENSGFLGYHITDPRATWTIMYGMMNSLKADYTCIEDFAVVSSTLEQLFIQFARAGHPEIHEFP